MVVDQVDKLLVDQEQVEQLVLVEVELLAHQVQVQPDQMHQTTKLVVVVVQEEHQEILAIHLVAMVVQVW